jgi:uroporphyrin-III C-methyltransferase/precorrin-2 dehydrogenase/sirohydrochlorin ferrochelatase
MRSIASRRNDVSPRIEPLAKLPVFWSLSGKRVVIAGGSDAAAWKTELLIACGAQVDLYCTTSELGEAMTSLLDRPSLRHHAHPWRYDVFAGAALALADIEHEDEARAFCCAARAAGVPVNIIDKPAYCQFQFGSIVNRSPVIVSISTDGAAPVLAQAIRQRIETLLPPALKQWAGLAQRLREKVNLWIPQAQGRRLFWKRFAARSLATNEAPTEHDAESVIATLNEIGSASPRGSVTLVGAGPGDAELLTLKAMRALQSADVILFDDLVSQDVLELARREAKRFLVGKRGGRKSCKQDDINDMMVRFAKAGKRVVRLKSGDPMIFGRAGEEIQRLQQEGLAVDIMPGVTAASAMAASLKTSLTHRDHAQQLRFVTAHSRDYDLPKTIDWASLAAPHQTTIFYMGGRMASRIEQNLRTAGMPSRTPVVILSSVSRATERRWSGPLAELGVAMERIGVDEPVLIGVGEVFGALAEDLSEVGHLGQFSHRADRVHGQSMI